MSAHTFGPWAVDVAEEGDLYRYVLAGDAVICRIRLDHAVDLCFGITRERAEANARLIAAAPDLLDALRQWAWAEINGDEYELKNARRSREAALRKAEGIA